MQKPVRTYAKIIRNDRERASRSFKFSAREKSERYFLTGGSGRASGFPKKKKERKKKRNPRRSVIGGKQGHRIDRWPWRTCFHVVANSLAHLRTRVDYIDTQSRDTDNPREYTYK